MKFDNIFIWGDSHGDYFRLASFVKHDMPKNSLICHVGDWGRGFSIRHAQQGFIAQINEWLRNKKSQIFVIRGNHDIPTDFDNHNEEEITFLADYTFLDINDERFGFIGGATSIDRLFRDKDRTWWEDEKFVFNEDKCQECDVLIMHSCPIECEPINSKGRLRDIVLRFVPKSAPKVIVDELIEDVYNERVEISKAVAVCKPSWLYYGHFHDDLITKLPAYYATMVGIDKCVKHT